MDCGRRQFFLGQFIVTLAICMVFITQTCAVEPMKAEEQVFKPEVQRKDVRIAGIDSETFEIGYYTGTMSVEDFGANSVQGILLAFHLTEDVFLMSTMGKTTTSKSSQEEYSGSDIFTQSDRDLTYYNIMLGYNLLPGEVFWGNDMAFNTDLYLTVGSGITEFGGDEHSTFVYGVGYRFIGADWLSVHIDMRNHTFQHDYFARERKVNNLEFTIGMAIFF
ncbi:MAG: outer membrane beta-barrel domain-containing protein [Gammaproteobacteria bacterium]|nr:outer membrane beta-barrel domain-containing protein [Gammaproteobacteria bacterium]